MHERTGETLGLHKASEDVATATAFSIVGLGITGLGY